MIIVPSRGRPGDLAAFLHGCGETGVTTPIVVRLDDDDPSLAAYGRVVAEQPAGLGVKVMVGKPSHGASRAVQEAYEAHPGERWYLSCPDDTLPRTLGWDAILRDEAGDWNVAYPDDTINGSRFAAYAAIGGEFVRAMGWLQLPGISHLYADAVWDHLGRLYKRLRYRSDVVLEHEHRIADETHQRAVLTKAKDKARFEQWRAGYRVDGLLAKIMAVNG